MPQDLIGCRKRRKLKALFPRVVVFVNDPSSVERRIDFAVFFVVLWSYGRKICLNMCHGNSENSCGCSYLLRICLIYGKWVYREVESLCKLLTANKVHFDLPTNVGVQIKILSILKLVSFKSLTEKNFLGDRLPPPPHPLIRHCLNRELWSVRRKISQFAVQGILVGIIIKASGASLRVTDLLFAFVFCKN